MTIPSVVGGLADLLLARIRQQLADGLLDLAMQGLDVLERELRGVATDEEVMSYLRGRQEQ